MTFETDLLIISGVTILAITGSFAILKLARNRTRKVSSLRFFVQIIAVVFIFMGLILGPSNLPNSIWAPLGVTPRDRILAGPLLGTQFPDGISVPVLACYYSNGRTVTCPLWQIQAYIFPFWNPIVGYRVFYTTGGLEKIAIVMGMIVITSLILGRFFCGWLCPFGLYMDLLSRLRKVLGKRHLNFSEKTNIMLRQSRYLILAIIIITSFVFATATIFGTELVPGTFPGGPQGTEAGIVSYINEPFCLVCPMRPLCLAAEGGVGAINFSFMFQITYGPLKTLGFYLTSINVIILVVITLLSLAYRRFWCRICPMGGLTALFSTFTPFKQIAITKLEKDEKKCVKCGVCKRVCPTQVTEVFDQKGGDVTVSGCMLCFRCVEMCPYQETLKVKVAGKTVMSSRNWLTSKDK
jgi:ferredoxin-type protein NapH